MFPTSIKGYNVQKLLSMLSEYKWEENKGLNLLHLVFTIESKLMNSSIVHQEFCLKELNVFTIRPQNR